jgi:hypothetical protein
LLEGRAVAVAGVSDAIRDSLASMGARIETLEVDSLPEDEERVGDWARVRAPLHAVVYDVRPEVAAGLSRALESTWVAVREVAVGALIPGEAPGKVVMIAPPEDAVCAGLENLARTLSVEWARYGITTVTVALGARVDEAELAELVSFLCSRGGEYLSGCRLDFSSS